ncbi:heme anaerobic degradation radical SAM methyltransferase ChuW/HutW, partial [Escherichia coli]
MNTNNTLDLTPHFALDGDQPFKDRRAMMPFRGAIPVAKEQLAQTWHCLLYTSPSPRDST